MKKILFVVVSCLMGLLVISCSSPIGGDAFGSVVSYSAINDGVCDLEDCTIEATKTTESIEPQVTLEDLEKDAIFNKGIEIIIPLSELCFTQTIPTMELLSKKGYLIFPGNGILFNILSKKGITSILNMDREDHDLYVKNIRYDSWELFVFLDNTLIQNTKGHNLCDLDQYPVIKKITEVTEDGEIQIFLKNSSTGEIYGTGVIQ